MPLQEFDLLSIKDLDEGRVLATFRQALRRLVADCEDRPVDDRPRKLALELSVMPVADKEDGKLKSIAMTFGVKDTIPQRKKTYEFRLRDGQLLFNMGSPDNFDQTTIDDIDPNTGKAKLKLAKGTDKSAG